MTIYIFRMCELLSGYTSNDWVYNKPLAEDLLDLPYTNRYSRKTNYFIVILK